jgi:hypothetical protein
LKLYLSELYLSEALPFRSFTFLTLYLPEYLSSWIFTEALSF